MNAAATPRMGACGVLGLLFIFLAACSSSSPTVTTALSETPEPTSTMAATDTARPTYVTICEEAVWEIGTAQTWIDANRNGAWDSDEQPLEGVQIWVDDTSHNEAKVVQATSNRQGLTELSIARLYCDVAPTEFFDYEMYAETPLGFQPTTTLRREEEPFLFGFASIDSPTPKRTASPDPTNRPLPLSTPTATPPPTPLGDVLRPIASIDEVLPGDFSHLYPSPDGALWLTTDQGVAKLVDATWTVFLSSFTGKLAGIDAVGRVWVVSEDTSETSVWDGTSWTVYGASEGWTPLVDVWTRTVGNGQSDGSGRFWLGSSQDVRVFDGERWTVFTPANMGMEEINYEDLIPRLGITVLKDTDEIWVSECEWTGPGPAGGRGVRWFDGQAWRGADSPVASGCATAIEQDSAGRIWLGVEEDVWRYDPAAGDWERFTPTEPPPFDAVRYGVVTDLVLDPSDEPWVTFRLCYGASCDTDVLYHLNNDSWIQITDLPGYSGQQKLVFDAAGTSWLFWDGGVYRVTRDVPELVADLHARFVTVDAKGRVWFVARDEGRDVLWTLD